MKKLFFLFVLGFSVLTAQDIPRGVFLGQINALPSDTGWIYTDLRSALNVNTLVPTITTPSDPLFSKSFDLFIRELYLWEYSTGQQMIYEAEQNPTGSWEKNYFATKVGNPEGSLWKITKNANSVGFVVKDAVPDSEYNFLQYGRKWYTVKFIMKADTVGIAKTTRIADVRVFSKTASSVKDSLQLRAYDFTGSGSLKTFEVRFSVDSITCPTPPIIPPKWDKLTGGVQAMSSAALCQEKIDLQVYWYNNADTWLDKVIVEDDSIGKKLFAHTLDGAIGTAASQYTSKTQLKRFYLFDEPPLSAMLGIDYVDKKLQDSSALNDTAITATFYAGSRLDRFIADARPKEILLDYYVFKPSIPHPTIPAGTNLRGIASFTYDDYRFQLQSHLIVLDSALGSAATRAISNSKQFWYVAQTHGILDISSKTYKGLRPLAASELKATIGMALGYGAKGILAWPYQYINDGTNYIYTGLVDSFYHHTTNNFVIGGTGTDSIYGGFKDMWEGFSQSMTKVKNLGPTLLQSTWQGSKKWFTMANEPQTYGSWNDVVKKVLPKKLNDSLDIYWQYYVETGHLKIGSTDYILAVNRRCDTSDTRNIIMYLKDTTTQWRLMEVATTDTTVTNDNGSFTKQYSPGDWKLFKVLQQGPAVPQSVSVSSYGGTKFTPGHAKVSWSKNNPSSPLQAISGYEIFRNPGGYIATVSASDSFYIDNEVTVGSGGLTIYYWVKAKDITNLLSSSSAQVSIGSSNWQEKRQGEAEEVVDVPKEFALKPNYPNPFNPTTTIKYELPQDVFVTVKIFNQLGQEISSLVNEHKRAGRYQIEWNATGVASGIYICKIEAGSFKQSKKMVFTK